MLTNNIMIEEIPNNKIKLDIPTFVCDSQLTKKDINPLPNYHHFSTFIGIPKSGKSSLSISLLTTKKPLRLYYKIFHNIIYVCPQHSRKSMKKNPLDDLADEKVFDDLDLESLQQIHEQIKEYADDDENTLIYIDDCSSSLKNHEIQKYLQMLIQNRRHLRLSIFLIAHNFNLIPLNLRKLINVVFLFKPPNKKEFLSVFDEVLFYDKNVMNDVFNITFRKPHDFLMIDITNQKLFRNFNELKFN